MTTTISPVKLNVNTQRGKKIGTTVGAGVATGYIAKNAKPLFLGQIPEMAVESGLSKKVGYAASGAAAVIVTAGIMGAGRLIGAGIGKIVDKVKEHKETKELNTLKAAVKEKYPDGIPTFAPVSPEKMQEMMNNKEYLKELLSY